MKNQQINPYTILGVTKETNQEEIKKAFRQLAVIHHPDRNGDPEKFKLINEAYKLIGDPHNKHSYDTTYNKTRVKDLKETVSNVVTAYFHETLKT
jgi:DnaJ-class molecular chaperone